MTNEFFSDLKQRPRKAESWLEVRKVSEYQRWSKVMEVSGYSLLPRAGKRIPARLERPAGSVLETTTTILSDNDLVTSTPARVDRYAATAYRTVERETSLLLVYLLTRRLSFQYRRPLWKSECEFQISYIQVKIRKYRRDVSKEKVKC